MKALTIYQPWASLIMAGAKPYEFRKWRAHRAIIGQRIVIHASAKAINKYDLGVLIGKVTEGGEVAASTCLLPEKALPIWGDAMHDRLPQAAGLGTAILGEPRNGFDIAEEFGMPHVNDSDRKEHANWGWPLTDIEVWDQPIPMKGMQGFWTWPEPEDFGL